MEVANTAILNPVFRPIAWSFKHGHMIGLNLADLPKYVTPLHVALKNACVFSLSKLMSLANQIAPFSVTRDAETLGLTHGMTI